MSADPLAFAQFRRLLVGIVVETLRETRIDVDIAGLTTEFTPESGFRFLWFDNWMRFRGSVRIPLRNSVPAEARTALDQRLRGVWPEIMDAVSAMPLADRLSIVRNDIEVDLTDNELAIRFDLEAD